MGSALAAALGVVVLLRCTYCVGWEKFVHGEMDILEDTAGIFLSVAAGALLVRNAVVVYRNQQLGISLQPHDGELPQGDIDPTIIVSTGEFTVKAAVDKRRDLTQITVAFPLAAAVHDPGIQDDWVHRFYY